MNENQKQEIIGFFTEKKDAYAFKGAVFLFDNIPEKKLQNAVKNYAPVKSGEEVVLLYEYSAKEGFVLTTESLYVNLPSHSGCSVHASAAVSDIGGFSHRKGKGLSPEEYIDIDAGSQKLTIQYMYGKQLMGALEKTVSVLKSGGLAASAAQPAAVASESAAMETAAKKTSYSDELKAEYEQGQREGEEFADKLIEAAGKAKNAFSKLVSRFSK